MKITHLDPYPIPPPINDRSDNLTKTGPFWDWYNKYLASPYWIAKRAWKLKEVGYRCQKCGASKRNTKRCVLQVHHLTYIRVGREDMADLEVRCKKCHDEEHGVVEPQQPLPLVPRRQTGPSWWLALPHQQTADGGCVLLGEWCVRRGRAKDRCAQCDDPVESDAWVLTHPSTDRVWHPECFWEWRHDKKTNMLDFASPDAFKR